MTDMTPDCAPTRDCGRDPDVLGNPGLTADYHKIADLDQPRNADLRHDGTVSAEPDIVPDLHEIIEPGTRTDRRIARQAAINRGVRADLHVVLKNHAA